MRPEINNQQLADYLAPIIGQSIIGAPLAEICTVEKYNIAL